MKRTVKEQKALDARMKKLKAAGLLSKSGSDKPGQKWSTSGDSEYLEPADIIGKVQHITIQSGTGPKTFELVKRKKLRGSSLHLILYRDKSGYTIAALDVNFHEDCPIVWRSKFRFNFTEAHNLFKSTKTYFQFANS